MWVAVGGMVVYIVGQGAVWTFMARIGANSGLSAHNVDVALSACTLGGLVGSIVTMFPSKRLGTVLPLTVFALLSVGALCVVRSSNAAVFIAALSAFMFAWPAFAALQFAAIAAADTVGTATISMSAANYAGFAIGPYLGGQLVVHYGFGTLQYLGIGGVLLALISLLPLRIGQMPARPAIILTFGARRNESYRWLCMRRSPFHVLRGSCRRRLLPLSPLPEDERRPGARLGVLPDRGV